MFISYIPLFNIESPPLNWQKTEFIEALHILSYFSRDELQNIVEEIYPEEICFKFTLSAQTLLRQIFAYYSPSQFRMTIHSRSNALGGKIQAKIK